MRKSIIGLAAVVFLAGCGGVASAPPELNVAALTFTPTPGKARIYVYRPSRFIGSAARLKVAIDSVFIGKTGSGTFMMIEVDPGHHRVSGLTSESDRGVEIDALADSSYFFKLWPKMGVISAQSGIEQVDAMEGRREVRKSRMVIAVWPASDHGVKAE